MSSRQEQKQRLRAEREERERQERERSARRRRQTILGGAVAGVLVAGAIVAIVAASGGGGSGKGSTSVSGGKGATAGLQNTVGPWPPELGHVEERDAALNLPPPSDTVFHIHAHLSVYTDGKPQSVPGQIGIDTGKQFLASLHTHDTSGVVHMEAAQPYQFRLGQFLTIWGVPFTGTQLGSYHVGPGLVLQTWVNGKQVPNGPAYPMKPHDNIVIGFGKAGSFPTKAPFKFPAGE
jgi:hypothetical protein